MRIRPNRIAVAAGLTVGLLAVPAFAGNGSNLLQYLPSNSQMVFGIDADNLRSAPFFQQVVTMATSTDEYQEAMAELGDITAFDPTTDIHTVVFASTVVSDASGDSFVFIVQADIDEAAVQTAIDAEIADALTRNAPDEVLQKNTTGTVVSYGDDEMTMAFLADNIVAMGTPALMNQTIAAASGTGTAGLSGTLSTRANSAAGGSIWFAANAPADQPELQGMWGSVSISSSVAANLSVQTSDAATASAAVAEFEAQRTALAGSPEVAQFGLSNVINGTTVAANGDVLTVNATIDAQTWTMLTATATALIQSELQ